MKTGSREKEKNIFARACHSVSLVGMMTRKKFKTASETIEAKTEQCLVKQGIIKKLEEWKSY